jgi:class 3 adenylate cyclase
LSFVFRLLSLDILTTLHAFATISYVSISSLANYLAIDRRIALARGETLPERTYGAALFADISGFTPFAESLAQTLGAARGAEELTRQLNLVYDALGNLTNGELLPMQYPGGIVYDAETLLADPLSGDLFVVTRDRAGEGVARVFRNPAPHTAGVTVTLELVATIPLTIEVKGGDVSPSGDAVLLRLHSFSTPADGRYWARAPGSNLWDAFSQPACATPLANEPQGEALAFTADGRGYLTTSEGSAPPIYFYARSLHQIFLPMISR